MTGWPLICACLVACRFGELSQHSVDPHAWQVRRWTHSDPIFTHSSHSGCFACLTSTTAARWAHCGMTFPFQRPVRSVHGDLAGVERHSRKNACVVVTKASPWSAVPHP